MWQQLPALALSSLISVIEWLPGSVGPYIVGKIVDEGIVPHDMATVLRLSLIMFGLVLEDANDEERTKMIGNLPLPIRILLKTVGAWQFKRYVRRLRAS